MIVHLNMSSLAARLAQVQVKVEAQLPDISQHSMEQLGEMTIKFGSTHVGKKFSHMWAHEQKWITWFLQHYPDSEKTEHRLVRRYVELKVEEAEHWNHKIPVQTSQKDLQSPNLNPKKSGYAKAKAKSQFPPRKIGKEDMDAVTQEEIAQWEALEALGIEEEQDWDVQSELVRDGEPTRQDCLEADVQSLQTRLLHMETMLQQVVSHIQASASKSTEN